MTALPAIETDRRIKMAECLRIVGLTKEQVADKIGVPADGIDELVARGVLIPPGADGLWMLPRIDAWQAGIARACNRRGIVYAVGFASYVKIGFTILNGLGPRLRSLQTGAPEPLEVYGSFEGTHFDEIRLLGRFIEYRTIGEWHRREGKLAEWIAEGCPR
jgi:hypothetical protein